MDLNLENKVIMIAGASKGLGYGIAQTLVKEGAKVSIGSRTESTITEAAHRLNREMGVAAQGVVVDVTDMQSIDNWFDTVQQHFGGIDGLVVNAGGPPSGDFDCFEDEDWQSAFELTLLSAVRMMRKVVPFMRSRQRGAILTITSSTVKEPVVNLLLSNVMRSGVASLVKSVSKTLAKDNIRINNLIPGRFDTDRLRMLEQQEAKLKNHSIEKHRASKEKKIPLGRYGSIEEFGKIGAFLLSDASSYITGSSITIDGGSMKTVF